MSELLLKNINKIYPNGVQAVFDFNIDIKDGEFIVLVGPSGCGKSTTLRMIAGLEDITSGEMLLNGNRINNLAPKDRDIAMVFQNYALYAHMTVYHNMAFSLVLRKENSDLIHERVMWAAEILGLVPYLNRKPSHLSGGQRQRVALGRAIVRDPKIFLLDEPLSNLDAKLRGSMRKELKALHKRLNTTMIYVTHDQIEALTLADRIVVMKDGYVQQIGTPYELYNKPYNLFVANFLGLPPMNILSSKVDEKGNLIFENNISFNISNSNIFNVLKKKDYINKEIYLGVRPENINININEIPLSNKIKINLFELLGSESLIHFELNNKNIISKSNLIDPISPSTEVFFSFNLDKLYFFDKDSEVCIYE